jgi:SAM-dependent methyltransferase
MGRIRISYGSASPFKILSLEKLAAIYRRYGWDPTTTLPAIFDLESCSHFRHTGVAELFRLLKVEPRHAVLSLGEGNGAPSRLLAKLAGCRVTCVDATPAQVRKARACARLHGVAQRTEYLCQDVQRLRLGGRVFDRLYANESAVHWPNKAEAMRRAIGHLRPGALIGMNEWLRGDRGDLAAADRDVPVYRGLYDPKIWFQISLEETADMLKGLGCRILRAQDVTREVDRGLRRLLECIDLWIGPGRKDPRQSVAYLKGMLSAHYKYLRYGRIIAQAP